MERIYYEETHHKLHEETEQEIISDLLDGDEERSTIREEISRQLGEFVTAKAGKSARAIEKSNER